MPSYTTTTHSRQAAPANSARTQLTVGPPPRDAAAMARAVGLLVRVGEELEHPRHGRASRPAHLSQPQEHRIRSGREAAGFEALSCRSRGQTRACPAADPGRDASARLRKQRPTKQRSRAAAASDPPPGNPPHRASSEWPLPALRSPVRYAGHNRRYNQAPSLPRLSSPGPHPALHQHPLILFSSPRSSPRSSPHPSSSSSCCVVDIYSPAVPAVGAVRRI